jgi:hypothetical protein
MTGIPRVTRHTVLPLVFVLAALFPATVASGQETRGSVIGTVTDSSGAVLPGVTVAVVNSQTNQRTPLVTNGRGYYEATYLLPGLYTVTASLDGFKAFIRSDLELTVNARLRVDITLEIGAQTESVTVVGGTPMLQTTTASASTSFSEKQVMELPAFGNSATLLARTAAGIQWTSDANYIQLHSNSGASGISGAGGVGGTDFALDGMPNMAGSRRVAYLPASDTIAEMKVDTSPFDASKGHSSGAFVSMLTRSGSNTFRGTATVQHWQQKWQALPELTRKAIEAANAAGNTAAADRLKPAGGHETTGAGTVGGPIFKNKLFFYATVNGYKKNATEEPTNFNRTVPSEAHRRGDFSDLLALDPVKYRIYDPRTAVIGADGKVIRQPFPNNQVPILNPLYAAYLKLYPLPNNVPGIVTADGQNNLYVPNTPWLWDYRAASARVDLNLSARQRVFARVSWNDFNEDRQDWTFSSVRGLHASGMNRNNVGVTGDYLVTLTPTTIFNVSAGYNRFRDGYNVSAVQQQYSPSAVGLPAYMDAKAGDYKLLPRLQFNAYTNMSRGYPGFTDFSVATGRAEMTKVFSTHSVKSGLDFRHHLRSSFSPGNASGSFSFNNNYVRQKENTSNAGQMGLEWAAFMLGVPSTVTIDTNDRYDIQNDSASAYVQDDWRVNSRLTLNLGMRVEWENGWTEQRNHAIGQFDPTLALPTADAAQAAYLAKPVPELSAISVTGGVRYLGLDGYPAAYADSKTNYMPRLGAVYEIDEKTVLRGGYGIFYDTLNVLSLSPNQYGFSRSTNTTITTNNGLTFENADLARGVSLLSNPFPIRADGTRFNEPLGNGLGVAARMGQDFSYDGRNWPRARQQRWRVGVQRQLTTNSTIEVAYMGSYSDDIAVSRRLNPLPERYWAAGNVRNDALAADLQTNYPNPFLLANFASLKDTNPTLYTDMASKSFFTNKTMQKQALLRLHPQMSGTLQLNNAPIGESKYHDFEVVFTKRFAHGTSFNVSYVRAWQRDRDWMANEFDEMPTWRVSNRSRPHSLTVNAVVEMPFGKGRRFLQTGIPSLLLGGWQVSGIYYYRTGVALNFNNVFWYGDTPKNPLDPNDPAYRVIGNGDSSRTQWFNLEPFFPAGTNLADPAARAAVANQTGPASYHRRVFPSRFDFVRGDSRSTADITIARWFNLPGRMRLQARVDLLNAFNSTEWDEPSMSATSTNFAVVTAQTNTPRWTQVQLRLTF